MKGLICQIIMCDADGLKWDVCRMVFMLRTISLFNEIPAHPDYSISRRQTNGSYLVYESEWVLLSMRRPFSSNTLGLYCCKKPQLEPRDIEILRTLMVIGAHQ